MAAMATSRQILTALTAVPLALGLASATYQRLGERRDDRRFPPPGELVDIGGRRLHVIRSGTGNPVVIVLPSLGTTALEWVRVQRVLAEQTDATIIAVDRGGIGWSDPAPWPRTPATMADELDRLIAALGINGPVILAGHSVGGLVARLYAARHRDRVARLILVDATHEDYSCVLPRFDPSVGTRDQWAQVLHYRLRILGLRRLRVALGQVPDLRKDAEREVATDLVDAHIARYLTTAFRRAVVQETLGFILGMDPMRAQARELGDLPVTVVTAGPHGRDTWFEGWLELQADFLTMSTNSRQVWARHADHHINHEHPEVLATVFLDAIRQATGSSAEPAPGL